MYRDEFNFSVPGFICLTRPGGSKVRINVENIGGYRLCRHETYDEENYSEVILHTSFEDKRIINTLVFIESPEVIDEMISAATPRYRYTE